MKMLFLALALAFSMANAFGQEKGASLSEIQKTVNETLASKWYERIQIRGYAQFRYNRLLESNRDFDCQSCDKSIGDKKGFFLRRARLTFFGEINDRVFIYIQPDYASDATNQNYFQIRDAYFDYALVPSKDLRVRTGISKVPYGWENLQSSSNRAALDRSDALNSGVPNERDTGIFLMYAPTEVRKRFKELTSNNLKGTGDYGMLAIGAYNGQSLNRQEENNDLHRIVRLTYPHKFQSGQFVEATLSAYEGKFNRLATGVDEDYYDQRSAVAFVVYPQPLGLQIEYNIGLGPEYDKTNDEIVVKNLKGGYVQLNYQFTHETHRFMPFVRYQEYDGGLKIDNAIPTVEVRELELGTEWQPNNAFELTAAYAISDRKTQSSSTNLYHEKGQLLRLQAQFNY